ncbi:ethanolamine-phosphate cytidylyltransferase, putative [Trypanosoma cruzi]|uniref:ethanolamine-phosphate cytidylyltransferase n=1 Tax=Trypanosoma cruzi (strain CL Brener) TaxID=353153 RepID=Q4DY47_TRYCC|nr:ethanolamine-phosphate cytidylyltransferase, putative [Trypanosoma cruzi]EAN97437.1 ethanolamine-phosphate cytidylyltransferase, putative [Trypanosoma cruzi]|eukprot:XP_819288.1 ethanolamine-phosphate cytidylyltransferase [Trypanosoma cruzi strain CL Brener]
MSSGKWHLNPDDPSNAYPLYATTPVPPKKPGTVRIWVDGCFDMLHFGHANALRQAAALGDELFVGCHSDAEIMQYKGPPIMHEEERYEALRACKWVDFVVEGYPYVTRLADMDRLEVDYVVHGDDISVDLNGHNSYQEIIDAGRFKVIKRTESISTTDLVGRMLLCNHSGALTAAENKLLEDEAKRHAAFHYLTTSRKIAQFSNNRGPNPGDRIVYVDGSFDLFHYGHIRVLQKARELGDYVIAGVHEESAIRKAKGSDFPIMSLNERVLGVLSCRYVDEVVLGAPYEVTREVIESLGITVVVGGKKCDECNYEDGRDAYAVPKEMGCFYEVDSECDLTTRALVDRVFKNQVAFLKRQSEKRLKEITDFECKPALYKNVREL